MFVKQLVHSTAPSTALKEFDASLADSGAVSQLLQDHYGYGQWKVTFPGEVRISVKVSEIFEIPYDPTPAGTYIKYFLLMIPS